MRDIVLLLLLILWIIQTLPAIFLALYVPWLSRSGVILGWLVGMATGTWMLVDIHFSGSLYPVFGSRLYIALVALVLNLVVTLVVSAVVAVARRSAEVRRAAVS